MLQRIIRHLNSNAVSTVNDLANSDDKSSQLSVFGNKPSQIPDRTVVEYCYLLDKAGYIYKYGGVYTRSQLIPTNLSVTALQNEVMDKETALMHQYNRLHSLNYPNIDVRIKKGLTVIDHLHIMQFRQREFHLYDFWDFIDGNIFNILPYFRKLTEHGYLTKVKDRWYSFTGKYIPFSISAKDLVMFGDGLTSDDKALDIKSRVASELELIEDNGVSELHRKAFKVNTVDDIKWVKSLVSGFTYLDKQGRLLFTKGFYDSIEVFDKYSKR